MKTERERQEEKKHKKTFIYQKEILNKNSPATLNLISMQGGDENK